MPRQHSQGSRALEPGRWIGRFQNGNVRQILPLLGPNFLVNFNITPSRNYKVYSYSRTQ